MSTTKLSVDDPEFVDKILSEVKRQGHFDAFRKECLADVDTQPAFQNLHTRVEDSVQKFLYRQVWTPETNKNRLREEMRTTIVRAGYLESGVNRIVDQVMEQKMDYIHSKVEEILYHYVGIAKPIKREKMSEGLVVDTDLMPTDLEQVSPDVLMDEIKDEEVEEEIVEDDDFESPAFEPIEAVNVERNEASEHSNLSAISGLTSENSGQSDGEAMEAEPAEVPEVQIQDQQQDSQISQFSSLQDMSQENSEVAPAVTEIGEDAQAVLTTNDVVQPPVALDDEAQVSAALDEEAQVAPALNVEESVKEDKPTDSAEPTEVEDPNKSQFDLNKDSIEFTGTERKSISLDDSANSIEAEKVLQPEDVPANTMEVDNLYSNDTTDSGEVKMEIDLKDDTTQGTAESKIEESSQDSSKALKEKSRSDHKKDSRHDHHRSDRSRDKHKSSSSHKSSHHSRSSSSKGRHDDRHKSRSDGKSSGSSSYKKSSSEKDRSSSSRRDQDKDRKSSKEDSSRSKHRDNKPTDDHQQEKSSSRRRRSTDHDSNDGKNSSDKGKGENSTTAVVAQSDQIKQASPVDKAMEVEPIQETSETTENKQRVVKKLLSESSETSTDSRGGAKRTSILIKYDYLKSPTKSFEARREIPQIEDGFCGFETEQLPDNPWFACLRRSEAGAIQTKKPMRKSSNNNYLEQQKLDKTLNLDLPKAKSKQKQKSLDSPSDATTSLDAKLTNGCDEATIEARAQTISQQQRYTSEDLFKPRFNFGNRSRRRGGAADEAPVEEAVKPSNELEIPS